MAEFRVEGEQLVLHLTRAEKLEGVHGDLHVPLSAVAGVELLEDAHEPVCIGSGIKIGTRIPGFVEVGTIQGLKRRVFAAVHHDTPRGVRVSLEGVSFDEWIVGCVDPEDTVARLRGLIAGR